VSLGVDQAEAADAALRVTVENLAQYGGPPGLTLGYGAIPADRIAEGLSLLARAFHQTDSRRGAHRPEHVLTGICG
jgi:hypothetical protein